MMIIAWVVVGLIAGFIASRFVERHQSNIVIDFLLGSVGA